MNARIWETLSNQEKQRITEAISSILMQEWNSIVNSVLTRKQRPYLRRPMLRLVSSKNFLGRWLSYPEYVIELDFDLVFNSPWYCVLDVFYHETAHALVDFFHPNNAEPPHGPFFQEICKAIGANAHSRTPIITLENRLFSGQENNSGDPFIDKVRKLLNLASSDNENEAQLALAKAMELMAKYHLTNDELNTSQNYVTISLGEQIKRRNIVESMLFHILEDFWQVRTIWVTEVDLESIVLKEPEVGRYFRMYISGTEQKVKIASYVYDYIKHYITTSWLKHISTGHYSRLQRDKQSFAQGVLEGFRSKLTMQVQDKNMMALIHKGDSELLDYFHSRYPHILSTSMRGIRCNPEYRSSGQQAGKELDIAPGLEKTGSPRLLDK